MTGRELVRWFKTILKKIDPVVLVEILAALAKLKLAKTPAQKHRAIADHAKEVSRLFR